MTFSLPKTPRKNFSDLQNFSTRNSKHRNRKKTFATINERSMKAIINAPQNKKTQQAQYATISSARPVACMHDLHEYTGRHVLHFLLCKKLRQTGIRHPQESPTVIVNFFFLYLNYFTSNWFFCRCKFVWQLSRAEF